MNNFETFEDHSSSVVEDEVQQSTIEIIDNGQRITIPHPELRDEPMLHSAELIDEDSIVEVCFSPETVKEMPFKDYLLILGYSSYEEYRIFCRHNSDHDQASILRQMQGTIIQRRLSRARELQDKFKKNTFHYLENQRESTDDHALIWRKVINDLGLPGISAETADQVQDYLDGIDEFLVLDLAELNNEKTHIPIKIGIQRSFDNKEEEVKNKHACHIPELANQGTIFKVFIQDIHGNYAMFDDMIDARDKKLQQEAMASQKNVLEYLEQESEAKNISTKQYLQMRMERLSLYKFLPKGMRSQLDWAEQIISQTMYQLETYIPQVKDWERDSLRRSIDGLKKVLEMIEEEKISAEIQK